MGYKSKQRIVKEMPKKHKSLGKLVEQVSLRSMQHPLDICTNMLSLSLEEGEKSLKFLPLSSFSCED